jgi:hypothetical protein
MASRKTSTIHDAALTPPARSRDIAGTATVKAAKVP